MVPSKVIPKGRVMIRVYRYDDDAAITENIRQVMVMRGDKERQKFPFVIIGVSSQSILVPRYLTAANTGVYTQEDYWVKSLCAKDDAELFLRQEGLEVIGQEDGGCTIIAVDNNLRTPGAYESYHRDVLDSFRGPGEDYRYPAIKPVAVARRLIGSICPAEVRGVNARYILWEARIKGLSLDSFSRQRIEKLPVVWRKPFFTLNRAKHYVEKVGNGVHFGYIQYWDIYEALLIDEEHKYLVVHDKRLEPID